MNLDSQSLKDLEIILDIPCFLRINLRSIIGFPQTFFHLHVELKS
jgi:hypothetical protein